MKLKYCNVCGNEIPFKLYNNDRVKHCSVKCNDIDRKKRNNIPLKLNEYILDKNILFLYLGGKKVDKKRKFEYRCDNCNKILITTINYQKNKEFRWLCRSCSTEKSWNKKKYRKSHVNAAIKLNNLEWRKKQLSESTRKTWNNNDDFRKKVLSILHSDKIKIKALKNRKYHRIRAYGVSFRSTYEYKFATALNKLNIKWEYEKKFFRLKTYNNKIYFPDFYIPKYNIWIETKGYFTKSARRKFNAFVKEYSNIKIKVFYNKNIKLVEQGNINEIVE